MAVYTVGGGGGLFGSLLPRILGLAGSAIGGPVGAGVGSAIGGLAGGQDIGGALLNGAGAYLGQHLDQEDWAKKLMEQNPLKPQGWGGGFRQGGGW